MSCRSVCSWRLDTGQPDRVVVVRPTGDPGQTPGCERLEVEYCRSYLIVVVIIVVVSIVVVIIVVVIVVVVIIVVVIVRG